MNGGAKDCEGLRYAAEFDEKILGVGCVVEVMVNITSGEASAVASMKQILSSQPGFRISKKHLVALASCVETAKQRSGVLNRQAAGSKQHQLNCTCGEATLIVVKPDDKPARYTLNIGLLHRSGELEELSTKEIDDAVAKLDELISRVSSNMNV